METARRAVTHLDFCAECSAERLEYWVLVCRYAGPILEVTFPMLGKKVDVFTEGKWSEELYHQRIGPCDQPSLVHAQYANRGCLD